MADTIGWEPSCLVPVPRSLHRRVRYGIDPGWFLASEVSSRIGAPVVLGLLPPLVRRRHAGRSRAERRPGGFVRVRRVPSGAVLIDDVVTTGRTIHEALLALGADGISVVTATSAGIM